MHETTKAVRASLTPAIDGTPLHAGPVLASPFHASGDAEGVAYTYGGSGNPTWTALEEAIAALEGALGVRTFSSGTAAMAAVFGAVLRPGDTIVVPEHSYFGGRRTLDEVYAPLGVTVRKVAHAEIGRAETVAGARLVWLESPSNPLLELTDLKAACAEAHAAGALVAVDNTTACPLAQQPLLLGADFSVCSDSKMMGGHSDVVLGHVAVREAEWLAKTERQRILTGATPGPMEAWLLLRSLPTLPLRLERSSANALALAEFLVERKDVSEVRYPGLPKPGRSVQALGQMRYAGSILAFTLPSKELAERFLRGCALVTEATSFGGVTTTAERRRRWGHDAVPEGFIRMSAGCEHIDDLRADIGQALDALRG